MAKITNLSSKSSGKSIFAGTSLDSDDKFITSGGRVLNAVGFGSDLNLAIQDAYRVVGKIKFKNIYYRNDIAKKGLNY